jgi:hypothetical protein
MWRNASTKPTGFTIVPKDSGDLGKIPQFPGDRKPVFTRFGYDIRMLKVDLQILTKVLKGYYDLNLLHQITHLEIKHIEKESASGPSRRGGDRADLEVIIHTEAVILDGAEKRQSLTAIPTAVAAVGGNATFRAAQNLPEFSRVMKPTLAQPLLAYTKGNPQDLRDYIALAARDVFHGPLPPIEKPKVEELSPFVAPPPPEDISAFLKLNGVATGSDGNREASIWDFANNHYYEVVTREGYGGKPEIRVSKYYWLEGKRKPLEKGGELVIEEGKGVATYHKFKVHGFYHDGLLLSETVTEPTAKDKDPKLPPKKDDRKPTTGKTAVKAQETTKEPAKEIAKPISKIAGEAIAVEDDAPPPAVAASAVPTIEKFYFWRVGQTLKTVVELPLSYRERSILMANVAEPKLTVAIETAPVPRANAN